MNKMRICVLFVVVLLSKSICEAIEIIPPKPYWWHQYVDRNHVNRTSDAPYITSDSFRAISDFIIDETRIPFYPDKVKDGDVIYLTTPYLDFFFDQVHPHIHAKYILLSHFGDQHVPGPYLDHPALKSDTLTFWFAMNVDDPSHPKMIPIPIGIGVKDLFFKGFSAMKIIDKIKAGKPKKRRYLLYMNHNDKTNLEERIPVTNFFKTKKYCYAPKRKKAAEYLSDIASSKFVVSPFGAGMDCYKTWEALYLGSYPIVRSSPLNILFKGLPVVIVDDWKQVTKKFLKKKYVEMSCRSYNMQTIYFEYWHRLIREKQKQVRDKK